MPDSNIIVGVYETHDKAIDALDTLNASGMKMRNISFISKADVIESRLYASSHNNLTNTPVEIGVVFGPVIGLLSGLSLFAIPGFGFIYGAGAIVGALAGFDIGLISGGVASILMKLGIHKDKIATYHEHLENGKYIISVHGNKTTAEKAKLSLHTLGLHVELQHHESDKV